jgi:hypothetical protein
LYLGQFEVKEAPEEVAGVRRGSAASKIGRTIGGRRGILLDA